MFHCKVIQLNTFEQFEKLISLVRLADQTGKSGLLAALVGISPFSPK